jgi:phosphoglycolate phosphatase
VRVLLSDLDGTIADTAPAIFEALHITCAAMDVELSRDADLRFCLGPPLHWCLEQLGVTDERMADAIAVFETAHTELIDLVVPMPGAETVIPELARAGVRIGVATIKPEPIATLVLDTIGLRSYITAIHARSDDMDPRTKTDLVRSAVAELGHDAIYTGDHDNDEQAAAALGLTFLPYPQTSWTAIRDAVLFPASTADVP